MMQTIAQCPHVYLWEGQGHHGEGDVYTGLYKGAEILIDELREEESPDKVQDRKLSVGFGMTRSPLQLKYQLYEVEVTLLRAAGCGGPGVFSEFYL